MCKLRRFHYVTSDRFRVRPRHAERKYGRSRGAKTTNGTISSSVLEEDVVPPSGRTVVSERIPRVSIGLAVYNGEAFLEQAIDSILAQTYQDFELIISDNASTDRTAEICKKYAEADPRIRYSRNPTNIGGVNNENLTFQLSRGEYFRLAAHDDVCAPTLVEKCVKALDENPDAVLCHSANIEIDENGKQIGIRYGREGSSVTPSQRFRELSWRWYPCEATYGVMRSSVLRKTRLQQNYTGSDRVLLCELGLYGRFILLEEPLFYKRFHPGNKYKDWRGRMAWFFPELARKGKATFPNWLQLVDYFQTLRRVDLPATERAKCLVWVGRWLALHSPGLANDLAVAFMMQLHSQEWRTRRYSDVERWL
jgi:glycosyltransferase involved in cell wall biosynthesis